MDIVLALAIISLAICYIVFLWSMLVVASRADERMEQMQKKEEKEKGVNQ